MKKLCFAFLMFLAVFVVSAVPASAKSYEENGFYYKVEDKQATVTGVDSWEVKGTELSIPATLGGFPVTKVGERAFYSYYGRDFESVVMPDTVVEIEWEAFWGMEDLKTVRLSENLETIGSFAFSGCDRLETVIFGRKVEVIGYGAFSECISLKKIELPDSVTVLGEKVFSECYKLSSIKLGENLEIIRDYAFSKNYRLKNITIPKKVKQVGKMAFEKCGDLQRVTFRNSKTKLDTGVFYECTGLRKANLPKGIKNIPEQTFYGCTGLKSVTVPKSVAIIKKYSFYNCSSLGTVKLNRRVYAIGDRAFAGSGLKKITLNSNMQYIGNGAFKGTNIKKLSLPGKVTFIGNKVFANCEKLRTIRIPSSVKGINPGAFNNCVSLRAINVSGGNKKYSSEQGVLYNKDKTLLIQYPLHKMAKSFRVPSSVKKIRQHAFAGNEYLYHVTTGAKVIGKGAFAKMKLRSATILNGTKVIKLDAFETNSSLSKVTLPDSVVTIEMDAFYDTAVRRVHIPSNLKDLGDHAFCNCRKIVAFEGGNGSHYKVEDGVLYNGNKTMLIKYPAKKPTKQFDVPESVKDVCGEAFENVSYLTKLEFGKRVRSIQSEAIHKAEKLKSIVINSKRLRYCSSYAVLDCSNLAVIVGPDNSVMRDMAERAGATLITL